MRPNFTSCRFLIVHQSGLGRCLIPDFCTFVSDLLLPCHVRTHTPLSDTLLRAHTCQTRCTESRFKHRAALLAGEPLHSSQLAAEPLRSKAGEEELLKEEEEALHIHFPHISQLVPWSLLLRGTFISTLSEAEDRDVWRSVDSEPDGDALKREYVWHNLINPHVLLIWPH